MQLFSWRKKTSFSLIIFKLQSYAQSNTFSLFFNILIQRVGGKKNLFIRKHLSYRKHKLDYPSLARTSAVREEVPAMNPLKYVSAVSAPAQESERAECCIQKPPLQRTLRSPGELLGHAPRAGKGESCQGSWSCWVGRGEQLYAVPWWWL